MKLFDAEFCCQGIRFLVDSSLLKNTSDDIGKFLYKGEGLNKTAIGDYLGERCVCVCSAFNIAQKKHRTQNLKRQIFLFFLLNKINAEIKKQNNDL